MTILLIEDLKSIQEKKIKIKKYTKKAKKS